MCPAEYRPLGRGELRALMRSRGISPKKALGQNFVVDPNTVERVARLARVGAGDRVVEVGAGLGSLTVALARTGAEVTAIEIDHRLVGEAASLVPDTVRLVEADALSCDWDAILGTGAEPGAKWVLVANLPYNVATPLIVELLKTVPAISRMLVMVQAEVGARFAASPGSRTFGAVTVRVTYFATARVVGRVPPDVFYPRARVDSVLVAIERRAEPAVRPDVAGYDEIDELVRAGFGGRRKMLRRSLAGLVALEAFEAAGIDARLRAEQLGVGDWGKLAGCRRSYPCSRPPS
jgi:16S rRNA (adenine1518-N6/adenine1519-N6)-dimethyltransferase